MTHWLDDPTPRLSDLSPEEASARRTWAQYYARLRGHPSWEQVQALQAAYLEGERSADLFPESVYPPAPMKPPGWPDADPDIGEQLNLF